MISYNSEDDAAREAEQRKNNKMIIFLPLSFSVCVCVCWREFWLGDNYSHENSSCWIWINIHGSLLLITISNPQQEATHPLNLICFWENICNTCWLQLLFLCRDDPTNFHVYIFISIYECMLHERVCLDDDLMNGWKLIFIKSMETPRSLDDACPSLAALLALLTKHGSR